MEIAGRIAKLGWHVVIYFEAADLPELWDFFTALPTTIVVDHMGRPDVTKPVDGPEFALFLKFMRENANVWAKVSGAERLSVSGPPALNGERNPYRDFVPFAAQGRRGISRPRDLGDRLAASQSQGPHARRRAPGRYHSRISRRRRRLAEEAPRRQSDAALLARGKRSLNDGSRQGVQGDSRHDRLRRRAIAERILAEPVLHVADEGREPRAVQGERARLSRRMEDDRGAEAGGARPRPQPHDGARRQHLFPVEDRRDRRQELPADGGLA